MKKLLLPAIIGMITLASCAQKEEKREEYKEDHYKNEMVNDLGDPAVSATQDQDTVTNAAPVVDSTATK